MTEQTDRLVSRTVEEAESGERLDSAVANAAEVTRSAAARLICEGFVTVDGQARDKNYRLRAGERLEIRQPQIKECEATAQNIPLDGVCIGAKFLTQPNRYRILQLGSAYFYNMIEFFGFCV